MKKISLKEFEELKEITQTISRRLSWFEVVMFDKAQQLKKKSPNKERMKAIGESLDKHQEATFRLLMALYDSVTKIVGESDDK